MHELKMLLIMAGIGFAGMTAYNLFLTLPKEELAHKDKCLLIDGSEPGILVFNKQVFYICVYDNKIVGSYTREQLHDK